MNEREARTLTIAVIREMIADAEALLTMLNEQLDRLLEAQAVTE